MPERPEQRYEPEPSESLGAIVRELRSREGLRQEDLAERSGTVQTVVSRVERGVEEPSWPRFAALLGALGWRPRVVVERIPRRRRRRTR